MKLAELSQALMQGDFTLAENCLLGDLTLAEPHDLIVAELSS